MIQMETSKVNVGSIESANALYNKFSAYATPPNVYGQQLVSDQTGTQMSMFPARIGSTDPEDAKYAIRNALTNGTGQVPGIGQAIVGDEFFNYAKRKQDQALEFDFQTWLMKQADFSTPASASYWYEKFPEMKAMRVAEIDRESALQTRLAKISVNGPENRDDFMILFLIGQGLIKPSGLPLYQLNSPDNKALSSGFVQGIFNPIKPNFPIALPGTTLNWSSPVNPVNGAGPLTGGAFGPPNAGGVAGLLGPVGGGVFGGSAPPG